MGTFYIVVLKLGSTVPAVRLIRRLNKREEGGVECTSNRFSVKLRNIWAIKSISDVTSAATNNSNPEELESNFLI